MGFPVPTYSFKKIYLGHAEDIHAVIWTHNQYRAYLTRNLCFLKDISYVKTSIFMEVMKHSSININSELILVTTLYVNRTYKIKYFHGICCRIDIIKQHISYHINDQWCIQLGGKLLRIMIMIHLSIRLHCFAKQGWKTLSSPSRPATHWSIKLSYIFFLAEILPPKRTTIRDLGVFKNEKGMIHHLIDHYTGIFNYRL